MIHYIVIHQNLRLEKLAINSEKEVQYSGMQLKQVKNSTGRGKKKNLNMFVSSQWSITKY